MEDLENLKKEIEGYSKEKEVNLIEDINLRINKTGIVLFDDFKKLIDFAFDKEVKNLFFEVNIFKEESFTELNDLFEDDYIKKLKEKYNTYFNKVSYIQLFFVSGGFTFLFSDGADWFDEYAEESREKQEDKLKEVKCKDCENIVHNFSTERGEEYCFECLGKKREEGETKIREMSKVLMDENEFNECKNEMQRKIYLEEKYPDLANNRFISLSQLSERTRALIDMKKRKN